MEKEVKTRIVSTVKKKTKGDVITYDGTKHPLSECVKIANNYYKVGVINIKDSGQAYKIGETIYRTTNTKLFWDYELNQYNLLNDNVISGVVGFKNGTLITGKFSANILRNINVYIGGDTYMALGVDILPKEFGYDPLSGVYTANPKWNNAVRRQVLGGGTRRIFYNRFSSETHNTNESNMFSVVSDAFASVRNNKYLPHAFDRFLNYTYGIETETSAGSVPEHLLYELGLVPLKDGSITGWEYATVVLEGSGIYNAVARQHEIMSAYCTTNMQCSLHLHIGGAPRTPEFAVALWALYFRLQDELDMMQPPYKRDLNYLTNKITNGGGGRNIAKDHCKRIPSLGTDDYFDMKTVFNDLMLFLNEGTKPALIQAGLYRHQKEGRPKWDFESRYFALNLLPLFFDRKGTVEFRLHSGTTNPIKALAWLFICTAIMRYAEANQQLIFERKTKITLKDVLEWYYQDGTPEGNFLFEYLIRYIKARKDNNHKLILARQLDGDEFLEDHIFTFNVDGRNLLTFNR